MKRLLIAVSLLVLSGCTTPGWMPFLSHDQGVKLDPGELTSVHFFPNIANLDTGVALEAGSQYLVEVALVSNWSDGNIDRNEAGQELDEKGFANSQMALEFLSFLKRSRQHQWFELMLYQPNCKGASLRGVTDLDYEAASDSYNYVASCDGELTLFVNDSYGAYRNNIGYARIGLIRPN